MGKVVEFCFIAPDAEVVTVVTFVVTLIIPSNCYCSYYRYIFTVSSSIIKDFIRNFYMPAKCAQRRPQTDSCSSRTYTTRRERERERQGTTLIM